jgi:Uma2 family endonuclease
MEAVLEKTITYDDLLELYPDESRVELIDNQIYEMASPGLDHQEIVLELAVLMRQYVKKHQLGKVIVSPFDVILTNRRVVIPDITFVSNANEHHLLNRGYFGGPDLVVEVISPSSYTRDNSKKKKIYADAGVQEYWIIEPANQVLEIWQLKGKEFELFSYLVENGKAKSAVLAGFEIDGKTIFG